MSLPKQYEVTVLQWFLMYKNDELKPGEHVAADHIVLSKRKSDNSPVWVRVGN